MGKGKGHFTFFIKFLCCIYCTRRVIDFFFYLLNQVKEQGPKGGEQNPYLTELLRLEEVAKQQGVGRWSKVSSFSFLWSTSFVLHEMNVFPDFAVVHIYIHFRNLVLLKSP
jgi:hypothetical protein